MTASANSMPILPPAPKRAERATISGDLAKIKAAAKKMTSRNQKTDDHPYEKMSWSEKQSYN